MNARAPRTIDSSRPIVQRTDFARALQTATPSALRILRPLRPPQDLILEEQARYVLGRHAAADIGFAADEVSRLHGVIAHIDGAWTYEDTGSRNGSTLFRDAPHASADVDTGEPIAPRRPLPLGVGDAIELGSVDARIEFIDRSAARIVHEQPLGARSDAMRAFDGQLDIAARTRVPVFLLGASGTGKTHSARQIHLRSGASGPFVPLNCARLPQEPSSLHSELLGHVRGAFTGADADRVGKLIYADGGTLLLDEVESLSPLGQGFLLDVLEGSGDLSPLGARAPGVAKRPIFRLISTSKQPLGRSGLRSDLCERLAEGHLWQTPSLRERREDIPSLISHFCEEQSSLLGVDVVAGSEFVHAAQHASWPGEIRQLKATVGVLAQMALARIADPSDWPAEIALDCLALERHLRERAQAFFGAPRASADAHDTRDEGGDEGASGGEPLPRRADARRLDRAHIEQALVDAHGNQSEAARQLGVARNTLLRKMRAFGLLESS